MIKCKNFTRKYKFIETGENKKARECFDFVLKTAGKHGFLAEQIDNNTMAPAWIIGLRLVTCNVYNNTWKNDTKRIG